MLNEKFDKIVCINLKERPDKKDFMEDKFEKFSIKAEFYHPVMLGYAKHFIDLYSNYTNEKHETFSFNKKFPNEFGTLHSHYYVIKTALLEGVKNLFVFEDDCAFHKDWKTLLPKYLNSLPDDWDGILLYSFMSQLTNNNIRVSPRWTKGFASWSLIAYGLNERAMEGYVKLVDENPSIADVITWKMMTQLNYNFYIASPPLIIPSKEFSSDIRGNNKNYENTKTIFMLGVNENNYI